jgi:hypothetical protein
MLVLTLSDQQLHIAQTGNKYNTVLLQWENVKAQGTAQITKLFNIQLNPT